MRWDSDEGCVVMKSLTGILIVLVFVVSYFSISDPAPPLDIPPLPEPEVRVIPVCEPLETEADTETEPVPTNWVQPTQDGEAFELYCEGLPSGTFGCAPERCQVNFSHPNIQVYSAVRREICRAPMDPALVEAVIHIESRGNVGAISEAGARGLMQIMPYTAREVAAWIDLDYYDGMEFDPGLNIRLGTAYLDYLLRRYADDTAKALTAYHRGPANTDAILAREGKLPQKILDVYATPVQNKRKELQHEND